MNKVKPLSFPKLMSSVAGTVILAQGTKGDCLVGVCLKTSSGTEGDVGKVMEYNPNMFTDLPIGETVTLFNKGD